MTLLGFALEVYQMQLDAGRHFLHEHPASASSWQVAGVQRLRQDGRVWPEGAGGLQFRVQYFCNMKPASKPSAVWLEGKNNTQLKIESKYLCQETGSYLTADKIKTFVPYGGERVYITREEVKDLKKVFEKRMAKNKKMFQKRLAMKKK